jgi:hypothetical protein
MSISVNPKMGVLFTLFRLIPDTVKDDLFDLAEKAIAEEHFKTKKPALKIGLGVLLVVRGLLGIPDDDADQLQPV